jgi:hypothetical protein
MQVDRIRLSFLVALLLCGGMNRPTFGVDDLTPGAAPARPKVSPGIIPDPAPSVPPPKARPSYVAVAAVPVRPYEAPTPEAAVHWLAAAAKINDGYAMIQSLPTAMQSDIARLRAAAVNLKAAEAGLRAAKRPPAGNLLTETLARTERPDAKSGTGEQSVVVNEMKIVSQKAEIYGTVLKVQTAKKKPSGAGLTSDETFVATKEEDGWRLTPWRYWQFLAQDENAASQLKGFVEGRVERMDEAAGAMQEAAAAMNAGESVGNLNFIVRYFTLQENPDLEAYKLEKFTTEAIVLGNFDPYVRP